MSMKSFSRLIFDLDGVLYRGHTPIAGAAGAMARIRKAGYSVAFITNNATRSRAQLQKRLAKMGIEARRDEIMTSAYAAACYLKSLKPKPRAVYALGERGLRNELRSAGFALLPLCLTGERAPATTFSRLSPSERHPPAHVLVSGLDRHVTYEKLAAALDVLNAGAKWVACNLDPTLPMENGVHPGSGGVGACLAYAAGKVKETKRAGGAAFSNIILREPDIVVGKPNIRMLELLCAGCRPSERRSILFVGDRLDMDIAFANAAGLSSLLVLSGVAKKEDAKKAKGGLRPGAVLNSVAQLPEWLGI
ncbi:MAG: HAD-IIA family hydrolase [Candidatus Marsarchaeota archaeon]|nr:HAD-IIA family hydrolase [Candidatus Marsarchaeota archaeon]